MTRSLPKDVVNLHTELGAPYKSHSCQLVLHCIQSIVVCALLWLQDPPALAIARRGEVSSRDGRKKERRLSVRTGSDEKLRSSWGAAGGLTGW